MGASNRLTNAIEGSSSVFKENCLEMLKNAERHVSKLGEILFNQQMADQDRPPTINEEEEISKEGLSYSVDILKMRVQYFLEKHGIKLLLNQFNQDFNNIGKEIAHLDFEHIFDYFHSPYIDLLSKYIDAITSDIKIESEEKYAEDSRRQQLEQFLRGTGKLLRDKKIIPTNEADVRREIYSTLLHFFPDTVREIPIARISKCYKPDIGIRSIKSAIEYKYATSGEEAKKIIGGIFEDVLGYKGSEDWKYFYAVLYMNDNYLTYSQILEEFKISRISKAHWIPILIVGKGTRGKNGKSRRPRH